MTRPFHIPDEPIAFGVGLITASLSFALGLVVGEPLIRGLLGQPSGFSEDYTTWEGVAQALLAQGVFLIPLFACTGYSLGNLLSHRRDLAAAVVIANPVNVFAGHWICYELLYTGRDLHLELLYFRVSSAALWSLMSVVLLAPVALLGLRFRRRTIRTEAA